jgi:putative colanic acid biosynthesis acetyltransferase WcaF
VGAQCIICPNTILETGAIVTAGSVATGVLEQMGIYAGNPAIKVKTRVMQPRLNK